MKVFIAAEANAQRLAIIGLAIKSGIKTSFLVCPYTGKQQFNVAWVLRVIEFFALSCIAFAEIKNDGLLWPGKSKDVKSEVLAFHGVVKV